MATTGELKDRVDRMGDTMDMLAKNYTMLSELVVEQRREMAAWRSLSATAQKQLGNHEEELAELRELSAAAHKRLDNHDVQMAELRVLSAAARKSLDNHDVQMTEMRQQTAELKEQTAEIRRDSQKTRRLWIAIAQKLDWLDLDEDFD